MNQDGCKSKDIHLSWVDQGDKMVRNCRVVYPYSVRSCSVSYSSSSSSLTLLL